MVRLLQKKPQNLKDLPNNWTSKEDFISKVADIIPDFNKFMFIKNGWQLTEYGADLLMHNFRWFEIVFKDDTVITGKILINLDQIINGPWFIWYKRMIIWNQDIFFEINLFDEDIAQFINAYVPPKN